MMFALVSNVFQPAPNSEVPVVDQIPGFKYSHLNISGPMVGVFGTLELYFIMLQDKNRLVAPPVTPKGRAAARLYSKFFGFAI
jgi:hypothetical protein